MNKKTLIILTVVVAALLIFSYCQFWRAPEETSSDFKSPSQALTEIAVKKNNKATPPPPDASAPSVAGMGFVPTKMEDPKKFEVFQKSVKDMAECLNMKVATLDPQAEINFDYFNSVISADLGDIVAQNEDWSATDLRTKSGEIRRIYIETKTDANAEPHRSLKYLAMSPGGGQKELPLSKEQMENPSDTLIASLESDGDIIGRSSSRRIFYQNGDDLLLVERNGKIFSFELPHDGKTFRCTGADAASTMQCQCK